MQFSPILSAIGTPSYKLAKFLVPKFSSITLNEFTVKDSFTFAKEIAKFSWVALMLSQSSLIYLLKRIINICTDWLYHVDVIEGIINKSEFENVLSLTTQELYFMFNDILYKQKDGAAMRSLLGPTMANVFLPFYEMKWI